MALNIIKSSIDIPMSLPVAPSGNFEPGQMAQAFLSGNQVVYGVSDGTAPIGIIDDYRSNSISTVSYQEVLIERVLNPIKNEYTGKLETQYEIKHLLAHSNVYKNTFAISPFDVELVPENGVVIIPAGTELNLDLNNDGIPDAVRLVCSYSYQVPNIYGDNTTLASGMVTVWGPGMGKIWLQTDQFEPHRSYPLNAPLFCSKEGKFTTAPYRKDLPCVGIVQGPPTQLDGQLLLQWG